MPRNFYCLSILMLLLAMPIGAQEKSADQIAWEKEVGQKQIDNPAYAYVEDDPVLPRVLLIGDSISIGYTARVREKLVGKANVHRIPTNGGDTNRGRENLAEWLGDGPWDVIHFNWGLHDLKRVTQGKLDNLADRQLSPVEYAANLKTLKQQLKNTGATLIWASTTPVPEGAEGRIPGDEVAYNILAQEIMTEQAITVNDLHGCIMSKLERFQRAANVHFTEAGSVYLGDEVARQIGVALAYP